MSQYPSHNQQQQQDNDNNSFLNALMIPGTFKHDSL